MAAKSNIRSMRFSDAVIEMIEAQAGDTFTAKFEALVTKCAWELPKKERELEYIQQRIKQEQNRLNRITAQAQELERNMNRVKSMMDQTYSTMKNAADNLNRLIEEGERAQPTEQNDMISRKALLDEIKMERNQSTLGKCAAEKLSKFVIAAPTIKS